MPKVSVIVPVYNVAPYLPKCMESLVSQTLNDLEIICINDGSTDTSLEILQNYAEHDERIKIIDKKNAGYGHTMNVGIHSAQGEYIGILESDDFTDIHMFEQLYQVADKYDADIVKSNYWEYRKSGRKFVRLLEEGPYNKIFVPRHDEIKVFFYPPAIWSAIYKRDFLLRNRIYFNETPGASFQDTSFNFMALACAERVLFMEEAYIHYRSDNESSSVNSPEKVYCVVDEYIRSADFLETRPDLCLDLEYLLPALKWNTYQWNYGRIALPFKYDFLEGMVNHFYRLWECGAIRPRYWMNKERLKDAMHIFLDKNIFLYRVYNILQKQSFLLEALKGKIHQYDDIYIYGAGKVGLETADILKTNQIKFSGFVVADMKDNPDKLFGKPVFSVNEIKVKNLAKMLILLAVGETTQQEVLPILREKGLKNVVAITNELRRYLLIDRYSIHQLVQHVFEK